jgi:hypothetical protein
LGILAINPRRAQPYHFGINIKPINIDPADCAAVSVFGLDLDGDGLTETKPGQLLLGFVAVWLPGFGGVDLCKKVKNGGKWK